MLRSLAGNARALRRAALPVACVRASLAPASTSAGFHASAASLAGESPIYKAASMLGKNTPIPMSPEEATLDRVPNPNPGTQYLVRFTCPEFTSICPVTGAPDFCHLVIDYVPRDYLVESKSLKLYLGSFRNHGAFHEACTVMVGQRLVKELDCIWLRVGGYWYPRGGIPIDVFFQTGPPPPGVWIPDQGVPTYRGRG
eukprot:tig00000144_g9004.t1